MAINIAFGGQAGNINLDNRVVVANSNSFSTEISFSVEIDGEEVLLPTVIDGEVVSEEVAVDHYCRTGEHLGKFFTWEFADAYAEMLHIRQEQRYGQ